MKSSIRIPSLSSFRAALLVSALILTGALSPAIPASASDLQIEEAETLPSSSASQTKAASCNPNGQYCSGYFDDLVFSVRHQQVSLGGGVTSRMQVWLQPDAVSFATTICTPYSNNLLVVRDDDPMADVWSARLDIALALGHRLRLDWFEGPSGYCELKRIYQPYG